MEEAEVFAKLNQLQEKLTERFSLEEEIVKLPRDLRVKQELLDKINKEYIEENDKSEVAKDELKSLRIQYDDAVHARENSEKQMELINTQREFEALEKEIKDAASKEQSLLKQVHAKEKQVNEFSEHLTEKEQLMLLQTNEVNAESSKIGNLLTTKKALLNKVIAACEGYIGNDISEELFIKFCNIVKNKKGKGIVPIHGLICQGCHIVLPIQFVNDVRSQTQIDFCPYCSRILYYEDVEGAEEQFKKHVEDADIEDSGLANFVDSSEFDDLL
ncbi:Zn-ribbon protein, possibly nucleic acid-binding protein [Sphaerochaeta pleomorpha str. Grapes]|uniref:Zn-ribbon protein, possibly nucleic acid-binding protein n=1 Tax=Sphaerochaeta pleomorpha (strain ATCC BAA-1885 / DSM 22778 / Grapes) TaxID=158190 RepID=G8QW58_SPHPG|nr:C4-type zinc ribbon domain-containing protein [Sphaerochaeta pleomorpha]AEV28301.1 Zn-ribbon protein, possibly nucleic acid-binding protein [Sphaerochaeta pleomorpha str. Grapes]